MVGTARVALIRARVELIRACTTPPVAPLRLPNDADTCDVACAVGRGSRVRRGARRTRDRRRSHEPPLSPAVIALPYKEQQAACAYRA